MPASAVAVIKSVETVLDRITDPVIAVDTGWRFTYLNSAAARIYQKSADELIGQNVWTLFPQAVDSDAYHHYHHALETGEPVRFEAYCEVLKIWVREYVYPSADGLTIYYTDITEERKASIKHETQLARSEERYRLVADFTYDLEYWRGPGGALRYVSPACERITGYTADEFLADLTLLERIIHPDDRDWVLLHFREEEKSRSSTYDFDFRIIHRDGTLRWINHSCQPVFGPDGAYQGRRGSNRDITERKRMEADLERERALLRAVLDQLPVGVIIAEVSSGRIICGNARMEQICRHSVSHAETGGWQRECQAYHPDGAPYREEEWPLARVIAGETIYDEEVRIQSEDKPEAVILMNAVPVHDQEGNIIAGVVVAHDITAIKELDHAKDEFLAVLSHELKTPLTPMLGWAEFALSQSTEDSLLRQAMVIVYRNARRQQQLIDELLDMSRLQHRRMGCTPEPTDLGRLAGQAVERAEEAAAKKGITLDYTACNDKLPIFTDPFRVELCIGHLLSNGIKFTPAGGTVTISCRREEKKAVLTVGDTGRGIAPEALPTIFTPFRQVDRDEAAGGLGLGLAIVRGIVELHHGRVHAESPGLELGSTFIIELPISQT
ncbi:MAG: PAS domain S-box protein [Armatimonadota bacterium]